jgi:membrane-associated protease RseP (regulator of RpoE activity)
MSASFSPNRIIQSECTPRQLILRNDRIARPKLERPMDPDAYIIVFAAGYGIISLATGIIVHELGHLLAARWLGIEVSGVSIGFGPEILGFTDRYGVRWKLAPLLVGGACRFPERPGEKGHKDSGNKLRTIYEASPKDRAIVLFGGPAFNLCFAGLVWLIIFFHKSILPFVSEGEVVFGLPAFLVLVSGAIALFNLLPIPPLDGGYLLLVAFEALRGRALTNEKHLIRVGAWVITFVTAVTSVLFLSRIVSGVAPHF